MTVAFACALGTALLTLLPAATLATPAAPDLESLQAQMAEGGMKELPIIIKADVQGSAEVLADTLGKLSDGKVV